MVADEQRRSLAGASRFCRGLLQVPSPSRQAEAFIRSIREEIIRRQYHVILPTDDVTLLLLAQARQELDGLAALPFPDAQVIQCVHDKGRLMLLAEEMGIPIPKTVIVRELTALGWVAREIGFPAVVKPRMSWSHQSAGWVNGGAIHYVSNAEELKTACRAVHQVVPCPIVQAYIPGEGRGVFLLMRQGKIRAAFAHRRIREKPPAGGVSVLSESVEVEPRLLDHAERILGALKWHGVAMLEFKHDRRDGIPKLLEINGRFWGSLQLAVDAGVDFPYLLYRLAVEGDVEPVLSFEKGVRLRWWLGELDYLFLRIRDCTCMPERMAAMLEIIRPSVQHTRSEVFRWNDPGPAVEELSQYARNLLRRRRESE